MSTTHFSCITLDTYSCTVIGLEELINVHPKCPSSMKAFDRDLLPGMGRPECEGWLYQREQDGRECNCTGLKRHAGLQLPLKYL